MITPAHSEDLAMAMAVILYACVTAVCVAFTAKLIVRILKWDWK